MSTPGVLSLDAFGVAFGDRVVLSNVFLELPRKGLATVVGPGGSGKSTLLRTLAGLNEVHPSCSTWGTALLDGLPLRSGASPDRRPGGTREGIGLVVQHARFFLDSVRENLVSGLPNRSRLDGATQTRLVSSLLEENGLAELAGRLDDDVAGLPTGLQRRLAVVCALVAEPPLLLADEPTAGLEDRDATEVVGLLRRQGEHRSVLFVTHNQRLARAAGGTTFLLAGGTIQESGIAEAFFTSPRTAAGRSFVETGGCSVPSPGAHREDLDAAAPEPTPLPEAPPSRFAGPRGFFWVRPGRLGGTPRPGIVSPLANDVEGLRRLGVSVLVTLEEAATVDADLLCAHGIASIHFPVVDMGAPLPSAAGALCRRTEALIEQGEVVAYHCRAGLGRTGTMLACQLVWSGEAARVAIDLIRRINPLCIQSESQVAFLSLFELFVKRHHEVEAQQE